MKKILIMCVTLMTLGATDAVAVTYTLVSDCQEVENSVSNYCTGRAYYDLGCQTESGHHFCGCIESCTSCSNGYELYSESIGWQWGKTVTYSNCKQEITCASGRYRSGSSCIACSAPSGWTQTSGTALVVGTHIKTNNSGKNGISDCYVVSGTYKNNIGTFQVTQSCGW
jgi:hypothetical protein